MTKADLKEVLGENNKFNIFKQYKLTEMWNFTLVTNWHYTELKI